ncbi:MAG: B12-binding domain-containing radical SAM protein [Syntrophobacteraceae bacterium]
MSKAPLILLVNPWITDFAAFDLWAKPMGLLILASLLKGGGCGVEFIDCLDRHDCFTNTHPDVLRGAAKKFGTGKYPRMSLPRPEAFSGFPRYFYRHGIHPDSFRAKLREAGRPDLVWVTSSMTYWHPGVREAVRVIREELPAPPVWLGGIYAKLCPEHAKRTSGADLVVTGPLSDLPDLLLARTGFAVKNPRAWSDFSLLPPPALELVPNPDYAPVLTSLGCPYRCPYCASAKLQPEWKRSSAEKIHAEILRAHIQFGAVDFAFYDDALLLGAERSLKPALERVARDGLRLRFHVPNALHIRALSREWCELLRASGFKTIRLGLETTTDARSREWGGKVDTGMFLKGVENLFAAGFKGDEVGVYILGGVPGQAPEEVAEAVETVKKAGARPNIAEYSPIPGTPMWAGAAARSAYDIEGEPLYHNNTFFACRRPGFTYEDMVALKRLARPEAQKTPV